MVTNDYKAFIASKQAKILNMGIDVSDITINPKLFGHQQYIVCKALQHGRCAIFADTGLGKSLCEIEFAHHVSIYTNKPVLILTPLCVASQMNDEGLRFGYDCQVAKTQSEVTMPIVITNYEKLHHFDASEFGGIVLDESSILKGTNGEYRKMITEFASNIHFRMTASATPSPNDHMELGTQCEFLGILTRTEMLATFFTHDSGETSKWRLKGHGRPEFWKWLSTWAIAVRKPSDLGFDDSGYDLPPLNIHEIIVQAPNDGLETLFAMDAQTLNERRKAKKDTLEDRVKACADLVNNSTDQWVVWCNLNSESEMLRKSIPDAFEVKGSDSADHKEAVADGFKNGDVRVLISKPSIFGFGLNWQHAHEMAFVGLSDSFEQIYQAIKREHRFGQLHEVNVWMISANTEGNIKKNIARKQTQHDQMYDEMIASMKEFGDDTQTDLIDTEYSTNTASGRNWELHLGDCVEEMTKFADESIDYSIFSPPFASLYTFSASDRDMSNCKDYQDFLTHFRFLAKELFRVVKTGRLISFHCMNLTLSKASNGFMGIKDFRGDLIRVFEEVGFVQHSEVVIWKDPIIAMQRTKAIGLLHKQVMKDSTVSRQALPDYLITMGKRGINANPVSGLIDHYVGDNDPTQGDDAYRNSINIWSKYASPVWMDINPSDTLQREGAKENDDERHISLLQLEVIHRALQLWTNPNDVVCSPFAGICSEGYEALKMGRRFKGIELKKSYFNMGVRNLKAVEMAPQQMDLLSMVA
jgi:superfamily II DNA or RNA helicase